MQTVLLSRPHLKRHATACSVSVLRTNLASVSKLRLILWTLATQKKIDTLETGQQSQRSQIEGVKKQGRGMWYGTCERFLHAGVKNDPAYQGQGQRSQVEGRCLQP